MAVNSTEFEKKRKFSTRRHLHTEQIDKKEMKQHWSNAWNVRTRQSKQKRKKEMDKLANLFKLVRAHMLWVHYGFSLCVEFVIEN